MTVNDITPTERPRKSLLSSPKTAWAAAAIIGIAVPAWILIAYHYFPPSLGKWSSAAVSLIGLACMFVLLQGWNQSRRNWSEQRNAHGSISESIMAFSPIPLAVLDRDGRFINVNDGVSQLLGYKKNELIGNSFLPLIGNDCYQQTLEKFEQTLKGTMTQTSLSIMHKNSYPLDIHVVCTPIRSDGEVTGVMVVGQDISETKRNSERIRYMAYYDDMTGLPNRRKFMMHLTEHIEPAEGHNHLVGVLYMDIDRFNLINDSFGREFGDMLLMQVAERLTRVVSEQDMAARMEGDEFAVLFARNESVQAVMNKARQLQNILEEPFELQGIPFHITASIGVVTNGCDKDPSSLMKKADMALGKVKDSGRNNFMLYSEEWNNSSLERLTLQHELKKGLQRNEFILYYQPQYHLSTGRIVGAEALVRWQHPERGMVPPGQFISLAEESGMIVQLGDWVLQEACRQNKAWQEAGLTPVPVSVNLSIRQFMQQNLTKKIADILNATGLSPEYLELEITETMTMDVKHATQCLLELAKLGVGISIDDFGTGYSSLNYLKNFPIDRLKIDRSFVRDIEQDPGDAAIVAAIIAMAHNLNLHVIAEGVETEEQMEFLKKHMCDEMQGYYWSPPVSGEQITELLQSDSESG
ncbi:EAL domain-containing protein [Paenibacillus tarimensis]